MCTWPYRSKMHTPDTKVTVSKLPDRRGPLPNLQDSSTEFFQLPSSLVNFGHSGSVLAFQAQYVRVYQLHIYQRICCE